MIHLPHRFDYAFVAGHPEWTFVYSSSVHKQFPHGQAAIGMNLDNCYPVPVRWSQCRSSGYFNDGQYIDITIEIEVAIDKIPKGKPIILFPRIGEGSSRMKEFAPKAFEFLRQELHKIKEKNVTYI